MLYHGKPCPKQVSGRDLETERHLQKRAGKDLTLDWLLRRRSSKSITDPAADVQILNPFESPVLRRPAWRLVWLLLCPNASVFRPV